MRRAHRVRGNGRLCGSPPGAWPVTIEAISLVDGDAQRVGRPAELLADGLGRVDPADLDAPRLPVEVRVTNIVWEACLRMAQ
jgi:hypothetical protein